jgi:ubiquinone/menaquinone biosynthesis C-methylase UbiE
MKNQFADIYVCPLSKHALILNSNEADGDEILTGTLSVDHPGIKEKYHINDGTPSFIQDENINLDSAESLENEYYEKISQEYDDVMEWVFNSFYLNELEVRTGLIDLLNIKSSDLVLETGCGTCRDSELILNRLSKNGGLFLQDLSQNMLSLGKKRLMPMISQSESPMVEFFHGNAVSLPFRDNYFDSAYHFGGLNLFSDIKGALAEMARVVRIGGKIVIGDEGLAPWLRSLEIGKILMNSSQLYQHSPPIEMLPEYAKNVCLRWIIQNAYYIIEFEVGKEGPKIDLDLPILGSRGGTHRTRYYGQLEGVSEEAKNLATKLAAENNVSLHQWLDDAIREKEKRGK